MILAPISEYSCQVATVRINIASSSRGADSAHPLNVHDFAGACFLETGHLRQVRCRFSGEWQRLGTLLPFAATAKFRVLNTVSQHLAESGLSLRMRALMLEPAKAAF